jgi:hypothetical protein
MKFLTPTAKQAFLINGVPAVGAQLFTYLSGTTTKTDTWIDSSGATANTNPIILDARGEADIWLDPAIAYTFTFSPSTDSDPPTNAIWTVDNINEVANPFVITDASTSAIQLVDANNTGVQIAYVVGDGLLEIAPVTTGTVGAAVVTIDPVPSSTATITTPDPLTISSDDSLTLTSGAALSLSSGTSIGLAATTTMSMTATGDLTINSTGGDLNLGTLGNPLVIGGLTWPDADGTDGQFLTTDGAGNLSWQTGAGSGTFAETGKVLLASGLLEQWTRIHVGDISQGTTTTWTFAQEFTGGVWNIQMAIQATGFGGVPSVFLTSLSTTAAVFTWYEDFSVTEDIYLHCRALGAPS